jgi:hypothetical protein
MPKAIARLALWDQRWPRMPRLLDREALWQQIGYQPHEKQILYHTSEARYRLANCGRRFGKSTMAGRDLEPKLFIPNKRFWIVGPTYDLGEKEFRVIWQDLIVKLKLGQDKRMRRAYNKKQGVMYIEFPWNTIVEVRSAQHPENLVGDALDGVIMSEAAKHNPDTWFRFIQPALSDMRGWADFPTTPEGYNWLYELWMYGKDNTLPMYESWTFPSWANLAVYPGGYDDDEIQLLKRTMSPESFLQEIGAEFGSFVGKIYPEWDVNVHVKNVSYNANLPLYYAVDWGYTNPQAVVFFQIDPQDRVYIIKVHYRAFMRQEEHIAQVRRELAEAGIPLPQLGFGDAADPEAANIWSSNFAPMYALPEAKENWRDGVDLVRSFLRSRDVEDEYGGLADGDVGFYVDPSCVDMIREFNNYKSKDNAKGMNVPEMGQKMQDHSLDAIRYGLVHIYKLGATYHLSDVMDLNVNRPVPTESDDMFGSKTNSDFSLAPSGSGGFFTSGGSF